MMNDKVVMKLNQVTRSFIMGEVIVEALKETSLEVYQGELLVILGPSGSGKSTLLNIVGGMDLPSSGELFFNGENLSQAGDTSCLKITKKPVGYQPT
ncbi:ATP-binding cassette domain-containing protein [Desulforamulus ruminis]|uniref:ABC transporter related protein n=1 Tax=Desulforamulus ruminis (strain ATCC 23193 / DSM 2154 / NCIMB 8452 / DL) TaxID=696281 RepID=F6DVJ1_DESRL|nr:ATP-binding cassette domain-containing protein [Desulforamulus ruminis]AEG61451.1 ABC transporter related protein [Desulforamulus ruminis DSM 2154]